MPHAWLHVRPRPRLPGPGATPGKATFTIAAADRVRDGRRVELHDVRQGCLHAAPGIVAAGTMEAGAVVIAWLDRASVVPAPGSRSALRSLSSATLAVGSAATFLVLVTLLSFAPEGGAFDQTTERDRAPDRAFAWQLRGALPSADAPLQSLARMAQRAPS